MITANEYTDKVHSIMGKTVAIVYIFEGETAPGFQHYHVWKSDVISLWMNAVQSLHCMPLILDVRTFVEKALNRTLPKLDYVINLNCGSCELSPMSLVPATCAFIGVPCIPCDAVTIVTGENKRLSNLIAKGMGLNVPQELPLSDARGIFRPLNMGSSYGVVRGHATDCDGEGLYQKFIPGYDITTPIVYNPLKEDFDTFPSIIYLPNSKDLNWFFGAEEKNSGAGYIRGVIPKLSDQLQELYFKLVKAMGIRTYCRIDARIHCEDPLSIDVLQHQPLSNDNLFFVEINPMPTVKINNSFGFCYSSITQDDSFFPCVQAFKETVPDATIHSFLLSCTMLALKPCTKEKRIKSMPNNKLAPNAGN